MFVSQGSMCPAAWPGGATGLNLLGVRPLSFQITFRKDHLKACLLSLGCDVMVRERSSFETYSMCCEQLLQHTRQRLHQKEQVGSQRRESQGGLQVHREALGSAQRSQERQVLKPDLTWTDTFQTALPLGSLSGLWKSQLQKAHPQLGPAV